MRNERFSSFLKKKISIFIIFFFKLFPIKKNKIFFFSYYGSQYGCNPKYISEHIHKNYQKGTFDLVWAFDDVTNRNIEGIRKVKTMTLKYFYELCTAKVIITNYRTTDLFRKRKNQFYVQTWHSSLRLKQIEKDAEELLPSNYIKMAKNDSKKIDLLLSGCEYSTRIFRSSFWYDGEILEYGTPRNDFLFQEDPLKRKEICKKLNISYEYKVVLYAPTFRKENNLEIYNLDYQNVLEKLTNVFGGNWVFLVKLHPHLITQSEKMIGQSQEVIDVTKYDDIQELLFISDVLISDYSSLIFDFSITNRPCFLYVPDLNEYMNQDRSLYFSVEELPFIIATSNENLLGEVTRFNLEVYQKDLKNFFKEIGSFEEGKASRALTSRIEQICFLRKEGVIHEAV